jgi:hypothetical protein
MALRFLYVSLKLGKPQWTTLRGRMRRLLVPLLLLVLALPAAALSARGGPDGTLSLRDGRGRVNLLNFRGSLIGNVRNGSIKIQALSGDTADPVVRGYEKVRWGRGNSPTYSGTNVRFRLIAGRYRVYLSGKGIFLSAVGRGRVMLDGTGSLEAGVFYDGFFSLNDSEEESLPDEPTWLFLASPEPPPPPPPAGERSG